MFGKSTRPLDVKHTLETRESMSFPIALLLTSVGRSSAQLHLGRIESFQC